jgi:hypothetical protein
MPMILPQKWLGLGSLTTMMDKNDADSHMLRLANEAVWKLTLTLVPIVMLLVPMILPQKWLDLGSLTTMMDENDADSHMLRSLERQSNESTGRR